ncbi:MAG: hypothetical protein ACHQ51_03625 [Elusimicrobiota bacterium]
MKDTRRTRIWTLTGVVALTLAAGAVSKRNMTRREGRVPAAAFAAESGLRDAVASPMTPATAGLAGKPVPTSWFKTPEQHHADIDAALMSSRRRRLARRVAVQ